MSGTEARQAGGSGTGRALIGVDVGGTHTDVCVATSEAEARGKALTTYDDFSRGVLESIAVAASGLGSSLEQLLPGSRFLFNATTVVTNAITELRGARVGVLVTGGFRDEVRLGGGTRLRLVDDHLQTNMPRLVSPRDTREVGGRIDFAGRELVPLDEREIEAGARTLVEENGVEAIAICFLSSYANPAHERAAAEIVRRSHPGLFVTASHEVSARRGEATRWTTAILNCFVHDHARRFLETISSRLREAGFGGRTLFFQGLGGLIDQQGAERFPLALLGAGPAAGAIGGRDLAAEMELGDVLLGDMGGTSFDTGLVTGKRVSMQRASRIGRFRTALPLVDVVSVGAGGGSIAWIGERGIPQVGPRSAGSTPGPAAYGRGGREPTVTDAMVAMDFIDVGNYLGGRLPLHRELAREALGRVVAEPMGWEVDQAAAAVHDLVVASMANAVREVSVNRGHDPRDFVFLAYGGTLPWFAMEIARALDIGTVIVPRDSSVFCARGLLGSEFLVRSDRTVQSSLGSEAEIARVNRAAAEMVAAAVGEMREKGFEEEEEEELAVARSAEIQFAGQVHTLTVPVPERPLEAGDAAKLEADFADLYERTYGTGTAWPGAPLQLLDYTVSVSGRLPRPAPAPPPPEPSPAAAIQRGSREVHLPDEGVRRSIPLYDEARFTPGSRLDGPALIEAVDTTVYVPGGVTAARDASGNIVMRRGGEGR